MLKLKLKLFITHLFLTLSFKNILSVTIPDEEIPKQSIQIQSRNFAVSSETCAITNCGGNGFCQINKQGYNVCHCAQFWSGERCGTMDMSAIFDRARSGSWLKSVDIEKYCKNYSSFSDRTEFEINHEMFKIIAITFFSGCFFTLTIACLVLCCSKLIQRPEGKRSRSEDNNNYTIRQAAANNGSSQAPLILTSNVHKDNLSCTSSNENSTRMHHHINLPTVTTKKPQKPKPKNILKIAKCNSLERKVPSAYINSKSMEVLNHSL